jgi:uncharacterized protein YndB with AHSA1/START domain
MDPGKASDGATVQLQRDFAVSAQRLFDAWTRPEVLAQWFGPEEFRVTSSSVNLETGGRYHLCLESPDGMTIKHFGEYVDISRHDLLTFT